MKRIVFLTSEYSPYADANGVCVKNAADELVKRGYAVTVICEGKENNAEDGNIIHVKDTLLKRLSGYTERKNTAAMRLAFQIFLLVRRVFLGVISPFTFPNVEPARTHRVYRALENLYKKTPFDYVIGTFRPYENVEAVNKFKLKHPEVKSEIVYLDLADAKNPFGNMFENYFAKLIMNSEKRTFTINDLVLFPKNAEGKYTQNIYDFAKDKIKFFDFPLFTAKERRQSAAKKTDKTKVVYAGSADGKNRSAQYFLQIADKLNTDFGMNTEVSFYGDFSDRKTQNEFENKNFVKFCGKVPPDEVEKVLLEADFLLNLSNKTRYTMIPSKIFQMFSTCLPIINMVANEKDASLEYFAKYPIAENISEYEHDIETDAEKIKAFLENAKKIDVDFDKVKQTFADNMPETFCDILI